MNVLMVIASLILLAVPVIYLTKTAQGKITPNPVTFGVRSVISAMNLVTYYFVADKDPLKSAVSLVSTLGLIAIFTYSMRKGRFSKIKGVDIGMGVVAFAAAVVWKVANDVTLSNLCLQLALFIPFIPQIRGVLRGVAKEEVLPWALATSSYVLMTIALTIVPGTTWQMLVHPVCVGILGNGSLMLAVAHKNARTV